MSFLSGVLPALGTGAGFLLGGPLGGMLGASLGSGISGSMNTDSANQASWDAQMAAQSYQTEMSNTSHQREVKDLQAAGLNPVLSGTGGAGASTPSASGAPVQMQPPISVPDVLTYGISRKQLEQADRRLGLDGMKVAQDVLESGSRIGLNTAQTKRALKEIQGMWKSDLVPKVKGGWQMLNKGIEDAAGAAGSAFGDAAEAAKSNTNKFWPRWDQMRLK